MNAESEGSQLSCLVPGYVCPKKKRQFGITLRDGMCTSLSENKSYYQTSKRPPSFSVRLPLVTELFKQPAVYGHVREYLQEIYIFN